jgi:hypothetical protein
VSEFNFFGWMVGSSFGFGFALSLQRINVVLGWNSLFNKPKD